MERIISLKAKVDFSEKEVLELRLNELERYFPYLPREYYNETKEILEDQLRLAKMKSENEID